MSLVAWRDRQCRGADSLGGGGLGATLQQFCLIGSLAILFYPLHSCGQHSCDRKLSNPFLSFALMWTAFMRGSTHPISQVGWNRCNLTSQSTLLSRMLAVSHAFPVRLQGDNVPGDHSQRESRHITPGRARTANLITGRHARTAREARPALLLHSSHSCLGACSLPRL